MSAGAWELERTRADYSDAQAPLQSWHGETLKADWNKIDVENHGIEFDEAKTVFADPLARIFNDVWHSIDEYREIIIGNSSQGRLLLVCFTEHNVGTIRIISSRETTTRERKQLEEHRHH